MKQVFHKIMSFAMAFVVLFSTMSFTINMHYCG
ncbi:HYC_CC_PP family protein, partial [Winogradskyella sp. UBA3174]